MKTKFFFALIAGTQNNTNIEQVKVTINGQTIMSNSMLFYILANLIGNIYSSKGKRLLK